MNPDETLMSVPDEPADFLKVPTADGGSRTLLTRLTDGRVMCCICFERFRMDELNPVGDGKVEDVCKQCAADEMEIAARRLGDC
jgi:hypothetical protein